jgi:hypothetical protein
VKLTPADLDKLQTKQLANVIRKLNAGKTLTAREEALLAQARAADSGHVGDSPTPATGGYAKTWDDLAAACSVDRRTLTNVRRKFGKKCPADRADGRKEVAKWITFLADAGVKGRGENNPEINFLDERELRLQERQLRVERERFELQKAKDEMISVSHVEAALGAMLAKFRQALDSLTGRIASGIEEADRDELIKFLTRAEKEKLTFKKLRDMTRRGQFRFADFHARRQFVESEIDAVRRVLSQGEYLEAGDDGAED